MSIYTVIDGKTGVSIDALAAALGITTNELKTAMVLDSLNGLVNEAERIKAGEAWDAMSAAKTLKERSAIHTKDLTSPVMDRHMIEAAKGMYNL